MIHGWPDDASVWKYQIPELTKKYDCYRIILPNYDMSAKNYEGTHSWGYTLAELAKSVNKCIKTRILSNEDEKVTLLIHDWGSFVGFFAYKIDEDGMYDRIISVDVGDHHGVHNVRSFVTTMSLEWIGTLCFLLPRFIGDIFNRSIPKLAKAPFVRQNKAYQIHAGMNYLFFYGCWRVLMGRIDEFDMLQGKLFKVPFLFIFGDKSPLKLHTQAFAKNMQIKPNGYVLLKGHTHWAMQDKDGQEITPAILQWLEQTDKMVTAE